MGPRWQTERPQHFWRRFRRIERPLGHWTGFEATPQVVNTLYSAKGAVRTDTWQRLAGSYHGSGCTLAAALAANLARGLEIGDAVYEAQDYTWRSLVHALRPGMGQHLPDRLFWARETDDDK